MFIESLWRDTFLQYAFQFENRKAIIIFPSSENRTSKWLLKTEYFDAYQDFEYSLVCQGYHLAYLENKSRWVADGDLDIKYRFRDYLVNQFSLAPKCIPVGMSCGGLHALKLASRYPDMIQLLCLDAPVVNLLSCPFGLGTYKTQSEAVQQEALDALKLTMSDVIAYRDHPLDHISKLVSAQIPMLLICGGNDHSVPFDENGIYLKKAYETANIPHLFLFDPNRGHHPHGPATIDLEKALAFVSSYS